MAVRIKTISVTYGRKFNLGNYESANLEVTFWADVDEAEDIKAATDSLWAQAKENIKVQSAPLRAKTGAGAPQRKDD
jgi:choline kinase